MQVKLFRHRNVKILLNRQTNKQTKKKIMQYMFSYNPIYPHPHDGALSAHINGDHDHVSRYNSYYQKDKLG